MPAGHYRQQPDDPQQAGAGKCDDHGVEGFTHAPQGAGEDLHEDKNNIERAEKSDHLHADFHDSCVSRKQIVELSAKRVEESRKTSRKEDGCEQTRADAPGHPFLFAGTVILPHKGGDGDAQSLQDHPENAVQLAVGSPGRNSVCVKAVDGGLDHEIGNRIHDRLDTGRQAQFQHAL